MQCHGWKTKLIPIAAKNYKIEGMKTAILLIIIIQENYNGSEIIDINTTKRNPKLPQLLLDSDPDKHLKETMD